MRQPQRAITASMQQPMPGYENGGERRRIQRDWLGHGIQLVVMLGGIGVPLLVWGTNVNTTLATLAGTVAHHEKDISDMRQVQTIVAGQVLDVNKSLVRIDTQLEGIREQNRAKR